MFRTNTSETCLQPWLPDYPLDIDRTIESLCTENTVTDLDGPQSSSAGNEIFSIAPGEGKHPVHFMTDKLSGNGFPNFIPVWLSSEKRCKIIICKIFQCKSIEIHWKICNTSIIFVF